jgi:DNA-binding MarR family transcriptional regulator
MEYRIYNQGYITLVTQEEDRPMSAAAVKWALAETKAKGTARHLLLILAWHTRDETGEAIIAIDDLAREANINRRNTQKCLAAMEAQGLIERRIERGGHRANRYRILGASPGTSPGASVATSHGASPQTFPTNREGRLQRHPGASLETPGGVATPREGVSPATPVNKELKEIKDKISPSLKMPLRFDNKPPGTCYYQRCTEPIAGNPSHAKYCIEHGLYASGYTQPKPEYKLPPRP